MFCFQYGFSDETKEMTSELFTQLTTSDNVVGRINAYRQHLPELKAMRKKVEELQTQLAANPDERGIKQEIAELTKKMQAITRIKGGLPLLCFQASTFEPTVSRGGKGQLGRWRKQSAVKLNGLFMLDVDHVENPRELFRGLCGSEREAFCKKNGILLVHVTPSGEGLRFVAIADPGVGNLADNQGALAKALGVEKDKSCKDASRGSFCPKLDDILFIDNPKLFTYENPEYDEKFGNQYRGGDSRPSTNHKIMAAGSIEEGYHGKSYNEICAAWFRQNGGRPQAGDRHQSLYKLACDIRYITDFDPKLLARVLAECEVGADIAAERGQAELDRIASDACALQRYRTIPKRFKAVLQDLGILDADAARDDDAKGQPEIDYGMWWARLKPLLEKSPGLQEAVVTLPDHLKLAGVLAAGAMFGTYLTRCWWEHFDGKDYRLSFLVYIIGAAASGKSFITELDRLIMAPMLASDRVGREWERQYKEEMKKRSASSKDAKAAAPDQQHPCIRYVPSTISNAMLYRRLTDAVDADAQTPDGQTPLHLHIYTMEPELATALRAQQGSWAGKNDLELKSFHNEYAGVDYANDQSVNGIIQVNWNQVVTGTPESMGRKIRPLMVLDGLVTRLVLFPMPENDFMMIDRRRAVRDHERECFLRSVGISLEQVRGELKAERLVDFCYDYEKRLTDEARIEEDYCLDYFRKRIPVIMMRYTLVRMVLRQLDDARKGEPLVVEDDDLEFARLIGDWCLMAQMRMFGNMVMEAQEREKSQFVPRKRSYKTRDAYAALPQNFKFEDLVRVGIAKNAKAASCVVLRWIADGLVESKNKGYSKKFSEIPI